MKVVKVFMSALLLLALGTGTVLASHDQPASRLAVDNRVCAGLYPSPCPGTSGITTSPADRGGIRLVGYLQDYSAGNNLYVVNGWRLAGYEWQLAPLAGLQVEVFVKRFPWWVAFFSGFDAHVVSVRAVR